VEGLSFYSIEANIKGETSFASTTKGEDAMDWKQMVAKFAGVAADVPDEVLAAAFEAKLAAVAEEKVAPLSALVTALSADVAALKPAEDRETEITALSATVATLKDELGATRGEIGAIRRQNVCDQAAREGKVIPLSAEQIVAMAPETLSEMVSKLPVTVPVDRRTPEHIQVLSASAASTALKRVAEKCGLDPAKVAEVNKAK
jgi:HAMP domain-containing protein